jgi:formylmethanofuran dehydrogenase subunit D
LVKSFTGYLYFIITGTQPDSTYAGLYNYAIARYGREEATNPFTFSIYKTLDFTSERGLNGQTSNNDFTIIENIVSGSDTEERNVAAVINSDTNKTTFFLSSTNTYAGQAGVGETVKWNGGDSSKIKGLKSVSVQTVGLPTAGQIVLKYKKDEELTWTTIFTNTTDSSVSHEASNIESTGANLPQFKDIQFRVEATGNAEVIGIRMRYEELAQNF